MLSNNSNKGNVENYAPAETQPQNQLEFDWSEYILKLKRRWKPALAIFLLTFGTTVFLSTFQKKNYKAEGKLLFKQNSSAALQDVLGEKVGTLEPLLNDQTPLSTQIEVITSEPVIQQVIDRLKLKDDQGEPLTPEDLEEKLSVELIGASDVVEISYKDLNPKVSSDVVNTLMEVYLQEQIRSTQADPTTAKEFINKQLPQVETQVAKAESLLENFRTENNIVDLKTEKSTLVGEIGELNQQIATTGSKLQGIMAQSSSLQNQLGLNLKQAVAVNQLGNSPVVESVLTQLTETESALAKERQRFNDQHPTIISLEAKKNDLTQQLQQLIAQSVGQGVNVAQGLLQNEGMKENLLEKFITLKIEELSLQRQVSSLYESQEAYLQRANQLPRLEKREQELLRQVESAGKTYKALLDNLQEVQLAANKQTGNAQIVEMAAIPEQGSSGRTMLLALGVILGAFLANLSVMLLEMQDRSLQTVTEIKKKFPYKILGITPVESPLYQGRVVTKEEPDSFSGEVYRMIQANLKFLTNDKPPKVILITSSVPEEGKSTVSANLAAAIAQLGRRVLLIDGDLRRSCQHRLWGIYNRGGLQDILRGNANLPEIISQPMPKLSVLASSEVGSNPLALLDSPAMANLVAQARRDYDLVLIDAPPLPVTADVLTMSKLVDGIVFVTRPGIVEHESAELAQEVLVTTGQKVLGMVINGAKPSDFDRYSYHARYGKRYFNSHQNSISSQELDDMATEGNQNNGTTSKARI